MKNNLFLSFAAAVLLIMAGGNVPAHAVGIIPPQIEHQLFEYYKKKYFLYLSNPKVSEADKARVLQADHFDINFTDYLIYHPFGINLLLLITENKLSKANQELLIKKLSDRARKDLVALQKQSNSLKARVLRYVHNGYNKIGQFNNKVRAMALQYVRYCKSKLAQLKLNSSKL